MLTILSKKEKRRRFPRDRRFEQVSQLRKTGFTYREIAAILNVSAQTAHNIHKPKYYYYFIFLKKCSKCGYKVHDSNSRKAKCSNCIELKKEQTALKRKEFKAIFKNSPAWLCKGKDRTREQIRHRDKYTCQMCGKKWDGKSRRFDVHHLDGVCGKKSKQYDSMSDADKLITLCHKCHYNHPEHSRFI